MADGIRDLVAKLLAVQQHKQPARKRNTRQENRVDRMTTAVEARATEEQILHYAPRDFVLCGLPYKRVRESVYERRNGNFTFKVVADPTHGVPFGQDRLIVFWLASAYRAQGCPDDRWVRFRCAADILRTYDIDPTRQGLQYVRLRERIERVFGATYYAYDRTPGSALTAELRRNLREPIRPGEEDQFLRADKYSLIQSVRVWFHRNTQPNQYTLWDNAIRLSEEFARDLKESSVPVDLQSVTALRDRPAALDLYVWQAWRSWRMAKGRTRSDIRIPLRGANGLLAQIGSGAKHERRAIDTLRAAQSMIRGTWPSCPNEVNSDMFILRPGLAVQGAQFFMPGVTNPVDPPLVVEGAHAQLLQLNDCGDG